jgi:hypothetical protein
VSTFFALIVAVGTVAPVASTTVPTMMLDVAWPKQSVERANIAAKHTNAHKNLRIVISSGPFLIIKNHFSIYD